MIAKIAAKKEVALDTLQVDFETGEKVAFVAGQFMTIVLLNPPYNDEKGIRRHLSIASSPNERGLSLVTRLRDTAFKKSLKAMPIGSEVEITAISGHFVLPEDTSKPLVFIAGGIGITPFISMLRYLKEEGLDYQVTLIYSNRARESTVFLEELEQLAKEKPNFKLVLTMTDDPSWEGEKRAVNEEFIKSYIRGDLNGNIFYVVGPPSMVKAVYDQLKNIGIESSNIKIENFTGY